MAFCDEMQARQGIDEDREGAYWRYVTERAEEDDAVSRSISSQKKAPTGGIPTGLIREEK